MQRGLWDRDWVHSSHPSHRLHRDPGASGHTQVTSAGGSWRVKWANLDKTHFIYSTGTGTRCPVASVADVVVTGTVTSDNTGDTAVGAALSGEFCVSASLTIALAPGTKFVING